MPPAEQGLEPDGTPLSAAKHPVPTASSVSSGIEPATATAYRQALNRNGYLPVPVSDPVKSQSWADKGAGKRPGLGPGWREQARAAGPNDISAWQRSFADCTNTGIVTDDLAAIDIDVNDQVLSDRVAEMVQGRLQSPAPVRHAGGPKQLLLCHSDEVKKHKTDKFLLESEDSEPVSCMVEVLATGQQFVAHGMHPSGHPYQWRGKGPDEIPKDQLPYVSKAEIREILAEAEKMIREAGGRSKSDIKVDPVPSIAGRQPLAGPSLKAPNDDLLIRAIRVLPNDYEYDAWIAMTSAIKAAANDPEAVYFAYEEWCLQYPDNTAKIAKQKWDSITDSKIGYDYVLREAQRQLRPVSGQDLPLASLLLTATELVERDIPPREFIIEPWLPSAGLAMVYAKRGVGKTYLAMTLAIAVAKGDAAFLQHYAIPRARRVLYIDGELPMADLQARMRELGETAPANLTFLSSEMMFQSGKFLNVHDPADQAQIDQMLATLEAADRRPELIILDSLSTLSSGADENDNSELDALLSWLIRLRHGGYTVLFLHHAGKGGDQRGASRREDLLDTSIKLEEPGADRSLDGAHFKLTFTKTRGPYPRPHEIDCQLRPNEAGKLDWTVQGMTTTPPHVQVLKFIYDHNPQKQTEIWKHFGKSKPWASQAIKKLDEGGLLQKSDLTVTPKGGQVLREHYPDGLFVTQDEFDVF
jgi:DNA-binding MarR family transcriptional regulator